MPNFPVELIENVLEHLYADYDRYSGPHPLVLFPCALVCRTWRTIAQSIIFSEIILKYPSPIKTFQKNNQLRLLVRRVLIDHSPGSLVGELLRLFPKLREIQILRTNYVDFGEQRVLPLPTFFVDEAQVLSKLTRLSLSNVSFPVKLFRHCTPLLHLKVNRCEVDVADDGSDTTSHQQSALRSFHFRGYKDEDKTFIPWILSPVSRFDLTQLTTLRIQTSDDDDELKHYTLVQVLVAKCASTVQDLMVEIPRRCARPNPQLTPERLLHPMKLSNMRTIRIAIDQTIEDNNNCVPWMVAFFASLPVDNQLEEILIACSFSDINMIFEGKLDVNLFGLDDLDKTLACESRNRQLKRVVLSVWEGWGDGHTSIDVLLKPDLRKAFPRLLKKGILEFTSSYRIGCFSSNREECWWHLLEA